MFLGLPACGNFTIKYHWTTTFTPPLFCCILLFITICHIDFYSFVLLLSISSLLPLLFLHYQVQCIPALHVVFLPCNSWALTSPSYCSVLEYLFISQIISFLPSILLLWAFSCVSLWHRLEFLQSQLHWLPHTPPSKHLQQPYWLTPYYGDFSPPTLFPVWTPFWARGFLLNSSILRMGLTGCAETLERNYQFSTLQWYIYVANWHWNNTKENE